MIKAETIQTVRRFVTNNFDGFLQRLFLLCKYLDIDECADPDHNNCAQLCFNTVDGYECSCEAGYVLQDNGRDCEGKFDSSETFVEMPNGRADTVDR